MNLDEYKYVIQVLFEDGAMYYNSGNYCLVENPRDATRYRDNNTKSINDDKEHSCSQGGVASVILLDDAKIEYDNAT